MPSASHSLPELSGGRQRVAAVLTAYAPDERLRAVVESAVLQCSRVVVVDNSPPGAVTASDLVGAVPDVEILVSPGNVGLAAALNRGIAHSGDSEFVLLLDQDSVLENPMVAQLAAHLDADGSRAAAAPAPWDAEAGRYLDPRTRARETLAEMSAVITSGMLMRRSAFAATVGMREDFFVDCVDQELCLQLRRAGWSIVQDKSLLLPHSLGETQWHGPRFARIRATHHPRWRLYWVARNGVMLSREYFRFDPRWAITNIAILGYWMITVLLFEPPRLRRFSTMLRGIADGLRGRRNSAFLPGGGA